MLQCENWTDNVMDVSLERDYREIEPSEKLLAAEEAAVYRIDTR